jgi:hypothetical protein
MIRTIMVILFGIFLAGCGSSEDNSDTQTTQVQREVKTAYFIDSAVEGVGYKSGNTSGQTDALGKFQYEVGVTVEFFIQGVKLGEIDSSAINADGYVFPPEILGIQRDGSAFATPPVSR